MLKDYGLRLKEIQPDHYTLGAVTTKKILREDGQYDIFLPKYEPQFGGDWDSYGCTVWGSQNLIETIQKYITKIEPNFSERFTYILAHIEPPGGDPHDVLQCIRHDGLILDDHLPMTITYEEFLMPNPMNGSLLAEGQKWLQKYEVKHEWLWTGQKDIKDKIKIIKDNLPYGPIGVSVTAWFLKDGVYVDNELPNTHWCMCYGYEEHGNDIFLKIFDSYDQSIKLLSPDHNIQMAKSVFLSLKPKQKDNWLMSFITWFINKLYK